MAFTKVVGAGIHTLAQLQTHNIHSAGIVTATKFVGEMESGGGSSTFQNVTIAGNLTVNGTTTTLDTDLMGVDKVEVAANNTTVAVAVTQSGAGDLLRLFDSTTEKLRITDDGLVGIGITNPSEKLDVNGTIQCLNELRSKTGNDLLLNAGSANRDVKIQVNDVNMLYVKGDTGNFGIGTDSPVARLHVHNSGTTSADHAYAFFTTGDTGSSASDGLTVGVAANQVASVNYREAGTLTLNTSSSPRITILSDGKVGINYTSPDQAVLEVQGAQAYASSANTLATSVTKAAFRVKGANNSSDSLWMGVETSDANPYIQGANGVGNNAKKLLLNPFGGNIGIGTIVPDSKLSVYSGTAGSVSADADADELTLESSGNTGMSILSPGTGESSIYFGNPGTNGQKDGWIKYYHETHSTASNRRSLAFRTSGNERLRIQSDGKVGINTVDGDFGQTNGSSQYAQRNAMFGVHGSITIANLSSTATDERELAFYRRGGPTPGTSISTHHMGRIAWYGSSNDTSFPDKAYSIECVPNGSGWTNGANRRASITFNNHNSEVMRIDSSGRVGIGTVPVSSEGAELSIRSSDGQTNVGLIPNTNSESSQLTFYNATNDSAQGYIRYDNSGNSLQVRVNLAKRLHIHSNGSVGLNNLHSTPDQYDPAARSLVVGEVDSYGHTGMTIASNGTDKQGAIYFADGTGSASYRGRIEYQHSGDSLRFGTAGSGGKVIIDINGDLRVAASTDLSSPNTGYKRIIIGNNLIFNAGSSAGGYTGFQNNAYVNSSGNWVRVNNDHASSIGMDDGYFYFRNVGSGTGNISWQSVQTIESDGRVNFLTDNGDITNPDIGGSCAGVSINKNTTGQIYASVNDAGGLYYKNWVMNLSRRDSAGDGPQLALDRRGWVKASIAGLSGSNTANGGPGQFAVYTHDYNTGSHVQKEQLKILDNGQWYIGRDGVGARLYTDGSSGSMYLQSGNGRQTFRIYDMASGQSQTSALDATGQFGLGTTSPADKLHIYHASNDPFIKIQRDTTSNVSVGGIKFASGASGGIFATIGSRVTSHSGERGCLYIQTQEGSSTTREPLRVVANSGGMGERLISQGSGVCLFGTTGTHGNQFKDGRPELNNVYEESQSDYRDNNGAAGGNFVVTGTGGSAATTYYPVAFSLHQQFPHVLTINKYVHNYGSWDGTLMFRADISGTGYGGHVALHRVTCNYQSGKTFIGRIKFTSHNNAYLVLWFLGGGRSYNWGTIGSGVQSVRVYDDGNNHNLGPGNTSEGPITSADTIDTGYEPNMNDSPSHQQTGFT